MDALLFKINSKKDYDEVNLSLLQQTLGMKGFNPKLCEWVQMFIEKGSVGIKVNTDIGYYFQIKKDFARETR
jgi:hypothetical protein